MAGMGRPVPGDGLSANLAGMSKSQLYDIMSQMKTLIEQNQQQAKQILIQNPLLTKALFQAQIMLGMVQPPQAVPNIQPPPTQHSQPLSGQTGTKDQTTGASQLQNPTRTQHQNQPPLSTPASIPGLNTQSQPLPSHPSQPSKGHLYPQVNPTSISQSSQIQNPPPIPAHQTQMPITPPSGQLQQPLQTPGIAHMPLQPQLPPQPRPLVPSVGGFQHQYPPPQIGPNPGFQHPGAPHHLSQPPPYHGSNKAPHMGPSFSHAQHPLPTPPPPQSGYQTGGATSLGNEFHSQGGSSMQVDRGSSWMSAPPENQTHGQHSAQPAPVPSAMGPGNQPPRSQPLTPEMEAALLQQVMSLTPEQINLLPPEQRNQVLQLQQMLRQ